MAMARIFCIPVFLILFLLSMKILCAPARAHAAEISSEDNESAALMKSITDYEDKYAFDQYGPPMPQNRARFDADAKLYEDMVQNFDEAAEDEPDFTFTVESYEVPVDVFRPEVIRPGAAQKESDDNPFGEDDPLPEAVKSTSNYVEEIRPTFLPGGPLKMHSMDEVKLGDEQGSLFSAKKPELLPAPPPTPQPLATAATPGAPSADGKAGAIDVPKKGPLPGSDEETLANLKAAVKQLGLERQLNLDPTAQMNSKEIAPDKPITAAPPVTPPAPAAAPAKAKKKSNWVKNRHAKHRTHKKPARRDEGIITQEIPIENGPAEDSAGRGSDDGIPGTPDQASGDN